MNFLQMKFVCIKSLQEFDCIASSTCLLLLLLLDLPWMDWKLLSNLRERIRLGDEGDHFMCMS